LAITAPTREWRADLVRFDGALRDPAPSSVWGITADQVSITIKQRQPTGQILYFNLKLLKYKI
jgi:hypothetical protein